MDDIYQMNGPTFFRKAWRMSAYQGVMKMRLEEQMNKENPRSGGSYFAPSHKSSAEDEVRNVTPEQMFVGHSELFELGASG